MEYPIRLNKYLAHQGIASRREADTLIKRGAVRINGVVATLGQPVQETDTVEVDRAGQAPKRYIVYYKGRSIITHSPGKDEVDVASRLEKDYGLTGIYPIGRLDKDSEGLLLVTDDGRITGPLLDPDSGHEREYSVSVDKPINGWFLRHFEHGVDIEGYITRPATVTAHPKNPKRFTLVLTEGKKHQIRRMCAALGYQVQSLTRTRIMHLTAGKLKPNQYRKLTNPERTELLTQLGLPTFNQ